MLIELQVYVMELHCLYNFCTIQISLLQRNEPK